MKQHGIESEVSVILLYVPANRTAQHFFFPITIVIASDGACPWTCAFRQLVFCVFTHIVSTTLLFVTRITKVSVSPAEPLGDATTEFTLELYKIFSMLRAVLNRNIAATRTN